MPASSSDRSAKQPRPDFMVTLGLIPPYTVDDVKQAYLDKVKAAHPDRGGDQEMFVELQEAFEKATKYAEIRKSRMTWIGSQMEHYIAQDAVIQRIKSRGGTVDVEQFDWLEKSFGTDFAQVAELLVGIHCTGPDVTDADLDYLVLEHSALRDLRLLDLSGSRVTDKGILRLGVFANLKELVLRDTRISPRGLKVLACLPKLKRLDLRGTRVGWLSRLRLRWRCPNSIRVAS